MLLVALGFAALAIAGWVAAWRARGQALDADFSANQAAERMRIVEVQSSSVRLSETLASNALSAARDQVAVERERAASLRHQLQRANADCDVLRRKIADMTPTREPIYDSTTKRLQNPAALARESIP